MILQLSCWNFLTQGYDYFQILDMNPYFSAILRRCLIADTLTEPAADNGIQQKTLLAVSQEKELHLHVDFF